MSLTAESPTTKLVNQPLRRNWVANIACVTAIAATIGYGRLAYYWEESDYLLLVVLFGVLLGSVWSKSFYPSVWGTAAAFAGAAGVPLARTFC